MGSVGRLGLGEEWPGKQCSYRTDVKLINDHLKRKLGGLQESCQLIPEFNIYRLDPLHLFEMYNEMSSLQSDGRECFFYCTQEEKNRKSPTGFWKGTGEEHTVWGWDGVEIGYKKMFVFHEGQQLFGKASSFSMYEYHLKFCSEPRIKADQGQTNNLVLCRITNSMLKETCPRNPSKVIIKPGTASPSNIANQGENQASPQIREMPESWWYEDEHQQKFTYNDQFHGGGCSSSSCSNNTLNCVPDYDDGIFLSELWD